MASQINASNSGFGGIVSTGDSSGVLQLQTTGTTAVTIDTSQNVGIGIVNGSSKLEVAGSGANNAGAKATYEGTIKINEAGSSTLQTTGGLEFKGSVYGAGYGSKIFSADDGALLIGNRADSATWTERMRIDQSGNVLIGTTTSNGLSGAGIQANTIVSNTQTPSFVWNGDINTAKWASRLGGYNLSFGNDGLSAGYESFSFNSRTYYSTIQFAQSGSTINIYGLSGSGNRTVYSTSTGALTNSSSDESLKTNIKNISYGLNEINAMNPVSYKWIDTQKLGSQTEIGFIAQEMQKIIPEVVGENTDKTLSIDYPKLTSVLVKAIQEQQTIINDLKARIETLEAK